MELSDNAYKDLVQKDIDWLYADCPYSLEREHIICILNNIINN